MYSPPTVNAQVEAQVSARAAYHAYPQAEPQTDLQDNAGDNARVTEHRLTIFHTNDLRGNIYSADGFDGTDRAGNQDPEIAAARGGLAALVTMIRAHEGAGGVSTLVLDGGNAIGATPTSMGLTARSMG